MIDDATFHAALLAGRPSMDINTRELHRAFERLHVRQTGLPTGVRPGRMWRTETASGVWWLYGFVPHDEAHCRVARVHLHLLPDGATVMREGEFVALRCAGRELFYGPGRVSTQLLQWDAQALAGGAP